MTRPDTALLESVRARLVRDGDAPSPSRVAAAVRAEGAVLGDAELLAVVRVLSAELSGTGPLEPLMADPDVTDILVNGPEEVWVDGPEGLRRATRVRFAGEEQVRALARRLAAQAGRRLDAAAPWCDARLPSGARLHAVLPPVAPEGACLSLRLPPRGGLDLAELERRGSLSAQAVRLLEALVHARVPLLLTGGTGTGKTTLLSALLSLAGPGERLVLVEDSAELRPRHPHVVRLQARPPNIEGTGEVDLPQLVRQALRMRPDRLVVGEVRGAEVVSLLAALNTGHEGGSGTVHANAAEELPARIEALACAAGLTREAAHSQLAATGAVAVHMVRGEDGMRRPAQVCVLRRSGDGLVRAVPAVLFPRQGPPEEGEAHADLAARVGTEWKCPPR
ncbi:TadA family conjugal transfer-associated ATPase [Nocardiopsis sp. RSe5-2]|uniref:TadA family conjugal transfer-associated ATPase n=1 Tax=Nocardiopsis endophytica TaxID=3018445 RepID=A0ABT4TX76_9ACTN|nr:TadA family conjugal transfer-associated ATPase [Nocardiopsis endophytica]MDA2809287.1 TadA family conjugal transfer-associated ATPase [Nocardiopsis endophytica]